MNFVSLFQVDSKQLLYEKEMCCYPVFSIRCRLCISTTGDVQTIWGCS